MGTKPPVGHLMMSNRPEIFEKPIRCSILRFHRAELVQYESLQNAALWRIITAECCDGNADEYAEMPHHSDVWLVSGVGGWQAGELHGRLRNTGSTMADPRPPVAARRCVTFTTLKSGGT